MYCYGYGQHFCSVNFDQPKSIKDKNKFDNPLTGYGSNLSLLECYKEVKFLEIIFFIILKLCISLLAKLTACGNRVRILYLNSEGERR